MNGVVALRVNTADVSAARLPATYEAAQHAIAECSRVDECRDWADKAAALASYARQAKDDSLRVMAVRIQARAERRCGELLKQISSATGAHLKREGALPLSRKASAEAAGLSEHQRKTALRLASVPAEEFDRQVESSAPPTITQLAEQGKQSRTVDVPEGDQKFRDACTAFNAFVKFCDANDAVAVAETFPSRDAEVIRKCVAALDQWLDRFITNLPEPSKAA
jgi:hypothetical protein